MPLRVHSWWEERIKSLKANNRGWGAGRITAALEKEEPPEYGPDGQPIGGPPSARWVGGFLKNIKDDELREYRYFYWPESMVRGDLPWKASSSALQLLAYLDINGIYQRPPVRLAKWWWRVTQTMPQTQKYLRLVAAQDLASKEAAGEPCDRGIEWWLAYMQIPDDGQRARLYRDAQARPDNPIPALPTSLTASTKDGDDFGFNLEVLVALGFGVRSHAKQESSETYFAGEVQL
jgi:hypothetical protein